MLAPRFFIVGVGAPKVALHQSGVVPDEALSLELIGGRKESPNDEINLWNNKQRKKAHLDPML